VFKVKVNIRPTEKQQSRLQVAKNISLTSKAWKKMVLSGDLVGQLISLLYLDLPS
jgi:hypothetical protein